MSPLSSIGPAHLERVDVTGGGETPANGYIDIEPIGEGVRTDAFLIAATNVVDVNVLASWICRPMVNLGRQIRRYNDLNRLIGYPNAPPRGLKMTSETEWKPFDCVKSMREIRNRIRTEITDMSYVELSRWLDRRVREDPFFADIPNPSKPEVISGGVHREGY